MSKVSKQFSLVEQCDKYDEYDKYDKEDKEDKYDSVEEFLPSRAVCREIIG